MSRRVDFPTSYADADAILGRRDSRVIANNTRLVRLWGKDGIAVRLHSTAVVTFRPDGGIVLRTGGWNTVTTRERITRVLGPFAWSIGTERGTLYVYRAAGAPANEWTSWDRFAWHEGLVLRPDGTTDAVPHPRRPYRLRAPHRGGCRCCTCRWPRRERYQANAYMTPVGIEREHTVTPEDTAADEAPDGVDGERWSDYNRKFNDLLAGRTG